MYKKIGLEFDLTKKLGAGSDREVFDLQDGRVIKIATTKRGLGQNENARNNKKIAQIVPKVFGRGLDFVIAEKVNRYDTEISKFLAPIQKFNSYHFRDKSPELVEVFETMGIKQLLKFDLLFPDIQVAKNWGMKDGQPKLIDMGGLNSDFMIDSTQAIFDEQWRHILKRRGEVKKIQSDKRRVKNIELGRIYKEKYGMEIV